MPGEHVDSCGVREDPIHENERDKDTTASPGDVRALVERQFMKMEEAHNRLRAKELAAHLSKT